STRAQLERRMVVVHEHARLAWQVGGPDVLGRRTGHERMAKYRLDRRFGTVEERVSRSAVDAAGELTHELHRGVAEARRIGVEYDIERAVGEEAPGIVAVAATQVDDDTGTQRLHDAKRRDHDPLAEPSHRSDVERAGQVGVTQPVE